MYVPTYPSAGALPSAYGSLGAYGAPAAYAAPPAAYGAEQYALQPPQQFAQHPGLVPPKLSLFQGPSAYGPPPGPTAALPGVVQPAQPAYPGYPQQDPGYAMWPPLPQPPQQQYLPDYYAAHSYASAGAGGLHPPLPPQQAAAPAAMWGAPQAPSYAPAAPGMMQEPVLTGQGAPPPPQEPDPDDDPNRLPTFVKVRGLPAEHDPRIARRPKAKKRQAGVCCA